MKVQVKSDSPIIVVTAFTGREYVQHEYRLVPDGCEEEALRHPFLVIEKQHDPSPPVDIQDETSGGGSDVPSLPSPDLKESIDIVGAETCLAFTQAGHRCTRKPLEDGYCRIHGGGE